MITVLMSSYSVSWFKKYSTFFTVDHEDIDNEAHANQGDHAIANTITLKVPKEPSLEMHTQTKYYPLDHCSDVFLSCEFFHTIFHIVNTRNKQNLSPYWFARYLWEVLLFIFNYFQISDLISERFNILNHVVEAFAYVERYSFFWK